MPWHTHALTRTSALVAALLSLDGCWSNDTPTSPTTVLTQRTPCTGGSSLTVGSLQGVRLDCSNGGTTVTLAGNGASYLLVPEFVTDNVAQRQFVSYRFFADNPAPGAIGARVAHRSPLSPLAPSALAWSALAPSALASSARAPSALAATGSALRASGERGRPSLAQMSADRVLRSRGAMRYRAAVHSALFSSSPSLALLTSLAVPSVGSTRNFHVLKSFATSAYGTVSARLAYAGTNILLYVDTQAPAAGFTNDQLTAFGAYFDQTLYNIAATAFGTPSDLDQNGHVIMLLSPLVNADTPATTCATQGYVAGFFDTADFDGPADANSNQGEIFYAAVPDPAATVSCAHTVADLSMSVPATFLHELQHLINYSQHVVVNGLQPGASWLDEGLSIVAEEMGSQYYEQKCPPPACRTDPAQIFPDSSQGFVSGFLYDSYQYALLPDTASITLSNDSEDGFSWRGGSWLFTHYLGDQGGIGVYQKLERGPSNGIADIEAAMGETFPTLFARFGTALYTDSIPGSARTSVPANLRFASRNLRQMWARLFATSGSGASPDIPLESPLLTYPVTRDSTLEVLVPGTTTYFRLNTPSTAATVTVEFSGAAGASFSPLLGAQLAIFRLP